MCEKCYEMVLHVQNHVFSWLQMASSGLFDGNLNSPCFMLPTWGFLGASLASFGALLAPLWGPLGDLLGPIWARNASWGRLGGLLGAQRAPKTDFWASKSCPGRAQGRPETWKSSFYEGFVHVGFPAAEAPRIVKKRSGAPPEASGSTIFGQNRHFTRVLARSRLLTISLPNAFF